MGYSRIFKVGLKVTSFSCFVDVILFLLFFFFFFIRQLLVVLVGATIAITGLTLVVVG